MHVDPETGQVKILQFVVASDCGTVIYPLGAEGQVEGGLAQGIGYALTEACRSTRESRSIQIFPIIVSRPCATCRRFSMRSRILMSPRARLAPKDWASSTWTRWQR